MNTMNNKTMLEPVDDAATANWGEAWQMPSLDQFEELINSNYTSSEWVTINGIYGKKITSKNNLKSIFLPAAGYRSGTYLHNVGNGGSYWSRSLSTSAPDYAFNLYFDSSSIYTHVYSRYYGRSVRPVRVQNTR